MKKSRFLQLSFYLELGHTLKKADLGNRARSLAFSLLMASIPLILVFVQLGSLFLADPTPALLSAWKLLPDQVSQIIRYVIRFLARSTSTATVGFGIFTALWLGSNGISKLILSVNNSMGFELRGNFLIRRLLSVIYTIVFVLFLMILLLFLVYSKNVGQLLLILGDWLGLSGQWAGLLGLFESLLAKLLPPALFLIFLILFYKTTSITATDQVRWREALVGGLFAGVAIFLVTIFYAFVMDHISRLSVYFGSLAGFLGLFVWLQYVAFLLLGGAEIMAAYRATEEKTLPQITVRDLIRSLLKNE